MKKILILIMFLISLSLVYATALPLQSINVNLIPVKAVVLSGQNAIFDLELTNQQGFSDDIKAVIMDGNWQSKSGSNIYSLSSGQKITERLTLFQVGYLTPSVYAINMRFVSTKNPEIYTDKQLVITVANYNEILDTKLETNPQGIDPRKENLVKLNLKSRYNINLEDLNVHIENKLFSKDFIINVNGLETKVEEFTVSIDPNAIEGDYDTKIFISSGKDVLVDKTEKLKVRMYSDVKETRTKENNFLISTLSITRVNDGNGLSNEVYSVEMSKLKKVFTTFEPQPTNSEKTESGYKYEWKFALGPGQDYKVEVVSNYRSPLLILILIVLLVYFTYAYLNKDVSMHKRVLILKSKEGGIAGAKILLYIKNNGQSIKNLNVTDEVPNELDIPHEYITLKPNSIRKGVHHTSMVWEIPELIRKEERVISYKLKSTTGYRGRLTIPRAVCRYKSNLGKLSIAKSNESIIST